MIYLLLASLSSVSLNEGCEKLSTTHTYTNVVFTARTLVLLLPITSSFFSKRENKKNENVHSLTHSLVHSFTELLAKRPQNEEYVEEKQIFFHFVHLIQILLWKILSTCCCTIGSWENTHWYSTRRTEKTEKKTMSSSYIGIAWGGRKPPPPPVLNVSKTHTALRCFRN